jgi:hypothetical protein
VATCSDVSTFLSQVASRSVTTPVSNDDIAFLQQAGLLQTLTPQAYQQVVAAVAQLDAESAAIQAEQMKQSWLQGAVQADAKKTHSILFDFEGAAKKAAARQKADQDAGQLRGVAADLAARQDAFRRLLMQKALLDQATPYPGGYVVLTTAGQLQRRDLALRLYRFSDRPFSEYWNETLRVDGELTAIADEGSQVEHVLSAALPQQDPSYLWAIAIGLVKQQLAANWAVPALVAYYGALRRFAENDENALMAAEILTSLGPSSPTDVGQLGELRKEVIRAGVPKPSALGVAAILRLGRRADGTFATDRLPTWLQQTRTPEAAALMAIWNAPFADTLGKFQTLRALFARLGYGASEDVDLASTYLTLSDLPADAIQTKLAILVHGMRTYLAYPLVGAAILASIPVLEANETLNLLERAYDILGRRAMPASQGELITLAIRMIHGIRSETATGLDPTAAAVPQPAGFYYGPTQRFLFVPVFVAHGSYYSTWSGIGGVHPGHVHGFGGGFVG